MIADCIFLMLFLDVLLDQFCFKNEKMYTLLLCKIKILFIQKKPLNLVYKTIVTHTT